MFEIKKNIEELTNTIIILVYKEDRDLIKSLDLECVNIFKDPLLFAYFKSKSSNTFHKAIFEEILQGYFIKKKKLKIIHSFNNKNIAYIPNIGYFKKGEQKPFMSLETIKDTSIEVIIHTHPLINFIFESASDGKISGDNLMIGTELFNKNKKFLTNAFSFIKTTSKQHFLLIEQNCHKCVMFITHPANTNSFATINAHGMAFFNVYQKDYDEVFFVDDIAHQTGHIILTTILFDRKRFFLIDENINIGAITNNASEHRSFYTLFHALFTYYTSLMCLDNCIKGNCFSKRQTYEAQGRIGFYLNKLIIDTSDFNVVVDHYSGIEHLLTEEGIKIYEMIEIKFSEIIAKWYQITKSFNYENQPYNFTYQQFIKLNPMSNA